MASSGDRIRTEVGDTAESLQTSDFIPSAEGDISIFRKALNPTFDSYRSDEGDENQSPNGQWLREGTPEADCVVHLPPGSWNKPYSPRSNPFGERPSQRTPGARSFVRRLSSHSSLSGGAVTNVMAEAAGGDTENVWLSTPEVSLQEVKSSWDAVGRIEKLLDDQISTEPAAEEGSGWRQRIANTAFHGTPSPTSSRASSLSGGEVLGSGGAQRRRSSQGMSPLAQGTPPGAPRESGTPDSQSAETFPRSFKIVRSGSADSLASLLSHTSDITAREGSSFEHERDALRERQMETIPEPGETPLRDADGTTGRGLFARSADGGMPVLATPRREAGAADEAGSPSSARSKQWLARTASEKLRDGQGTPRLASEERPVVQKAEGAFASPIEVQNTVEFSLPAPTPESLALPADRRKAVATPFAKLRQPAPLTPVIKRAHERHAQVRAGGAASSSRGLWPIMQLLLVALPLIGLFMLPDLASHLPHFNAHILPSGPFTASHQTSSAAVYPGFADRSWGSKSWTDLQHLFWTPAKKPAKTPAGSIHEMLTGLFQQDNPGSKFGLLGKPSPPAPTPHLDRLLGTVSAWWAQMAARLPPAVVDRLPTSMQPPKPQAKPEPSSTVQKATDAALKAAEQTKASIQRLVRSVQHNILPQPEPILKEEERPMAGSLKPKLQAAPMPAPPTLVKKASAAQKQVVKEASKAAEQVSEASGAAKDGAEAAMHKTAEAATHTAAAGEEKAEAVSARAYEGLQRLSSVAGKKMAHASEKLSGMAQQARLSAERQARQVAGPLHRAARHAEAAATRSAYRAADTVQDVLAWAKQGAADHPQGIMVGAAVAALMGALAGLLALIARPTRPVETEPEAEDVLGGPIPFLATPVPLFTPRPIRRSRLGITEMPTSPRTAMQQRATAAMSMPPTSPQAAPSTARTARAARTAPISSSKLADIMSTADTPAARTRSRSRRAV